MSIDKVLEEVVRDAHFKDTLRYAAMVIRKRRKTRVLLLPAMVGVAVGTLGTWWLGLIWGAILAMEFLSKEVGFIVNQIQLHQVMRLAARMAAGIADAESVELPEAIRKQADMPEWPPVELF